VPYVPPDDGVILSFSGYSELGLCDVEISSGLEARFDGIVKIIPVPAPRETPV
jgi:hypothetical protein